MTVWTTGTSPEEKLISTNKWMTKTVAHCMWVCYHSSKACLACVLKWHFQQALLMLNVAQVSKLAVSGDSSMQRSLKVTEAVITGCLQPAETLPGTTTSRQRLWLETSKEEMQVSQVPSRSTKYNLTELLFCLQTDTSWLGSVQVDLVSNMTPLTPKETTLDSTVVPWQDSALPTSLFTHTQFAGEVSCRWQQTEGHWWFLTPGGWSLFTVTSSLFSARQWSLTEPGCITDHSLCHHGYYRLSSCLRHHFSY